MGDTCEVKRGIVAREAGQAAFIVTVLACGNVLFTADEVG